MPESPSRWEPPVRHLYEFCPGCGGRGWHATTVLVPGMNPDDQDGDPIPCAESEQYQCECEGKYTATPSPGSGWVFSCRCGFLDRWTEVINEREPCTCPHSTLALAPLPEGTVGLGVVRCGTLLVWREDNAPNHLTTGVLVDDPRWDEAWDRFQDEFRQNFGMAAHTGAVRIKDGLVALVRGEEECRACPCGHFPVHRLERVSPIAGSQEMDFYNGTPEDFILSFFEPMFPERVAYLLAAPSRGHLDRGELGEMFVVDKERLG